MIPNPIAGDRSAKTDMTTFQIKLLAAALMVCDHIGYVFFPGDSDINFLLRLLGRFSFPLFAWLIGQGEKYTKNFNIYLLRVIGLGLFTQPLYSLVSQDNSLNILVTLALGLLAIRLDKIVHSKFLFAVAFAVIAELIVADYGAYGVFLIVLLSHFDSTDLSFNNFTWWIAWSLVNLLLPFFWNSNPSQPLAIFTPLILLTWKGNQGRKAKWFYLFYPLHFALILLVKSVYFSS